MKSTLIRMLAVLTLATSISGFALSEKPKTAAKASSDNTSSETTAAPSKADQTDVQSDDSQEKSQRQRLIEKQEKEWLKDVQNIVAG